ncbi:glycosyltransferase family 87 protein [Halomicrococcus gelatinilyticus]|uniref:glycosyltransferase family 87 protein n=1 Tax=Halomicrococcus gelatinilyticus TaxID=1702103 RepID=UPI002E1212D4
MRRAGPRLVLALGLVLGVATLAYQSLTQAGKFAIDFQVYYYAARASLAGDAMYAASPPAFPAFGYVYPPVTVVAFYPFALVDDWLVSFALFAALKLVAGIALALLLVRTVERFGPSLSRVDEVLVGGYVLLSIHSVVPQFYGETNLPLAFALAVGFVALERGDEGRSGVAFGLAALVKVFPAGVGLWLLRRRSWRAVGAAVATGGGLLALGVPLFGLDVTRTWLFDAVLPRLRHDAFAGGLAPEATYFTLRRPLSVLGVDPSLLPVFAAVMLAPVVAYCYRDLRTPTDRLVGAYVTLVAVLLFFPTYFVYFPLLFFPLVPLLYLLEGRARRLFLAGALVTDLPLTLGSVRRFLDLVSAPTGVRPPVLAAAEPVFTLGTPLLWGCLLTLAGCVCHVRRTADAPEPSGTAEGRPSGLDRR